MVSGKRYGKSLEILGQRLMNREVLLRGNAGRGVLQ